MNVSLMCSLELVRCKSRPKKQDLGISFRRADGLFYMGVPLSRAFVFVDD